MIKARAIEDIHLGMLNTTYALTLAVTPVVCGVRPAFLVDNVILGDDELEVLVKSLQKVFRPFWSVVNRRRIVKFLHSVSPIKFS